MSTKRVLTICGIILALFFLLDLLFVEHHVTFWWHGFIGFDIIFGFLGCLLLIVVAKGLGKLFIQKPEQYYGGGEDNDD